MKNEANERYKRDRDEKDYLRKMFLASWVAVFALVCLAIFADSVR